MEEDDDGGSSAHFVCCFAFHEMQVDEMEIKKCLDIIKTFQPMEDEDEDDGMGYESNDDEFLNQTIGAEEEEEKQEKQEEASNIIIIIMVVSLQTRG